MKRAQAHEPASPLGQYDSEAGQKLPSCGMSLSLVAGQPGYSKARTYLDFPWLRLNFDLHKCMRTQDKDACITEYSKIQLPMQASSQHMPCVCACPLHTASHRVKYLLCTAAIYLAQQSNDQRFFASPRGPVE